MVGQDVTFVLYAGLHDIPAALEDATFLKAFPTAESPLQCDARPLGSGLFHGLGQGRSRASGSAESAPDRFSPPC